MGIDLDITKKWKVEGSIKDAWAIGPIFVQDHRFMQYNDGYDDLIAMACVAQFKAVADAAECFMSYLPTSALEHIENRLRGSELTEALKGLKNRIKELKDKKED